MRSGNWTAAGPWIERIAREQHVALRLFDTSNTGTRERRGGAQLSLMGGRCIEHFPRRASLARDSFGVSNAVRR